MIHQFAVTVSLTLQLFTLSNVANLSDKPSITLVEAKDFDQVRREHRGYKLNWRILPKPTVDYASITPVETTFRSL